jgi:hypothetical protein
MTFSPLPWRSLTSIIAAPRMCPAARQVAVIPGAISRGSSKPTASMRSTTFRPSSSV